MKCRCRFVLQVLLSLLSVASGVPHFYSQEESFPQSDRCAVEIRNLDTPCSFSAPKSKEEWVARAKYLRRQILMSAGLWPTPEKTPLSPQIFGKIEQKDYSIEKVFF